jgi:hypothetical protein
MTIGSKVKLPLSDEEIFFIGAVSDRKIHTFTQHLSGGGLDRFAQDRRIPRYLSHPE